MTYAADTAETLRAKGALTTYAYRDLGPDSSSPPLVLLQRYRATLDHWDPAFLDAVAARRRVLTVDSIGVGQTPGSVPTTVKEMADAAADFIGAVKLDRVDVLGWSLGGFVAQALALDYPQLVRRLIIAGSTAGGVPGAPELPAKVMEIMVAESSPDEDFLYLFFGQDAASEELGRQSLARLAPRLKVSGADIEPTAWGNQLQAIGGWASGQDSAWSRLDKLDIPVLIANGIQDPMVAASDSFAMAQRLTNAKTVLYSDASHGFLFQHPQDFAREVVTFLAD